MGADEKHAATYHGLSDDTVRGRYCDGTHVQTGHTTDGAEYDTWLAGVKAEAKAEALKEAASELEEKIERLVPDDAFQQGARIGFISATTYLETRANQYKEN